jgi:hypothetical protein
MVDWMLGSQPPYWFAASIGEIQEAWALHVELQGRWFGQTAKAAVRLEEPLRDALERVNSEPGTNLVIGTTTEWSASYYNWAEQYRHVGPLSDLVPCATANFVFEPVNGKLSSRLDAERGFYFQREPRSAAEAQNPQKFDARRGVNLHLENGRWSFTEYGSPLPFEDAAAYRKSRRASRVTDDMLLFYADALRVPVTAADTYSGQALLVYGLGRGDGRWPDVETEYERWRRASDGAQNEWTALIDSRIARRGVSHR